MQDLRWMERAIRRFHPDPYAGTGREALHGEVERLAAAMGPLERPERVLGLMRVVAHVRDAHTRLVDLGAIFDRRLPVSVGVYDGELWIDQVQAERPELDATRILAVGGQPTRDVVRRLGLLVPFDNEVSLLHGAAAVLPSARALLEVGLVDTTDRVQLRLADVHGVEFDVVLDTVAGSALGPWTTHVERRPGPVPPRPGELWWYEVRLDGETAYLRYDKCRDRDEAPYFADFAHALLERLDTGGIRRLVVDLRFNGGGDSRVLLPLREGLEQRAGGSLEVVCLIGPGTYSSGVLNAWQLATEAGAKLVGAPTGGRPNHFGELKVLHLPNSGLELHVSTKTFHLVEGEGLSLEPDVEVPTTFEELLAGRDPVLEAALASGLPSGQDG